MRFERGPCAACRPSAHGRAWDAARRRRAVALAALLAGVLPACASPSASPAALVGAPGEGASRELYMGELDLPENAVIDGDTIRVAGLDSTLRLIGIDTEETFKHEEERQAYAAGWESYKQQRRGDSPRPVKMATPLGDEAKEWAKQFFHGVERVRLERDDPQEARDRYGRYLAYVLVQRGGKWLNYNVEAVRAGMGPYFTKYGYARRFHRELAAAQDEARAAQRGVWDPAKQHYPDYDERLAWWEARARFVEAFLAQAGGRAEHVALTRNDADARLRALVGREAEVLGTLVELADKGTVILALLSTSSRREFKLVFRDRAVLAATRLADYTGEFIRARGIVTLYRNPRQGEDEPQLVIERPEQITGSIASPRPASQTGRASEGGD